MASEDDDDIPLLQDVLRPGDGAPARPAEDPETRDGDSADERQRACPLTDDEIEAIASRVIERHTARMQEAVTRAIRQAIDIRNREQTGSEGDSGDQ